MDDRQRIEAMAQDGRITREEADRLLSVLDDIDTTEQGLDEVEGDIRRHGEAGPESAPEPRPADSAFAPATPPVPPVPPVPQFGKAGGTASGRGTDEARSEGESGRPSAAPRHLKWMDVQILAGDLEIVMDDSLDSPSVSGKGAGHLELEDTERGARLRASLGGSNDSILGRIFGGITSGAIELRVPGDWGLKLDMKAGDVEIEGPLAFLAGSMLAGDLDASEVHGVDLKIKAGDVDVALLAKEGSHRIQAVAGDLRVRLLPGSDVTVHGRVNIGDLSAPDSWRSTRRGLGTDVDATIGAGNAELDLSLGTGDLTIEEADV